MNNEQGAMNNGDNYYCCNGGKQSNRKKQYPALVAESGYGSF
jgi:hypothetical protein